MPMDRNKFKYVYGPVPSRRLGRSLGIDLVTFKTCTYDCIYCQLGRTTAKTIERKPYVGIDDVLEETARKLNLIEKPDFLSLAGSGEPTLHSDLGYLIKKIKKITDVPVAVLTNGSLLWMEDVQNDLMQADIVLPSLDAGDETLFQYINRPCENISFKVMAKGIYEFTKRFKGNVWLEIMILKGLTSEKSAIKKIEELARYINPDRIQLNTASRPTAKNFAVPVSMSELLDIKNMFHGNTDIISEYGAEDILYHTSTSTTEDDIISMLERRPCSTADISKGLGIHINEITKILEKLSKKGGIETKHSESHLFYSAKQSCKLISHK